jgi:Dna[CI] antecedent DciA-like protein
MRKAARFETVGTVLDQVMKSLRLEQKFAAADATGRWTEAVDKDVLARTRCVGVRDAELLVEVQGSVMMGHLAVLKQGILDRMNRSLPAEKRISAIRFVPMRTKEEIER